MNGHNGKTLEDAFWQKSALAGRPVTSTDVITAYHRENDVIRAGIFFEQLLFRHVAHDGKDLTPDQVMAEFNRQTGQNKKCEVAKARFKAACCLKGLMLCGRQITADAVVQAFPDIPAGRLSLAFFKDQCRQNRLLLSGRQVTPDEVANAFRFANSPLELARFMADCCLMDLPLTPAGKQKPEPVTPGTVVRTYPDNPQGKQGIARFKAECCLRKLRLNGRHVTPDEVARAFLLARTRLDLAHFMANCCLRNLPLTPNGKQKPEPVTPDMVIRAFRESPQGNLGMARFIQECCLEEMLISGQRVTPDAVLKAFPNDPAGKLGVARFRAECCLRELLLNGQKVTTDEVVKAFLLANAPLELARFMETCCQRNLPLSPDGKQKSEPVTPDKVFRSFPNSPEGKLGRARFQADCCLKGLLLSGQQITPDEVVMAYRLAKAPLELARFMADCCLRDLRLTPVGKQIPKPVSTDSVVNAYRAASAPLEIARFKAECCLRGLLLRGQQATPDEVVQAFRLAKSPLALARFLAECCLKNLPLTPDNKQKPEPVTPDAVVRAYPDNPEGKLGIARFLADCCLKGLQLKGQQVTPDEVIKAFPKNPAGKLGIARFKEKCCLRDLLLSGQQVTPDAVVKSFPDSLQGKLGIAYFKKECCLKGLLLNGRLITPDTVVNDFEQGGWLLEKARFYSQLALNAKKLNGNYLNNHQVLEAFRQLPGDHASRQADYLLKRLHTLIGYDDSDEMLETFQQARTVLNNVPVRDDENRRQLCILHFIALQYNLPVDQRQSAEQILLAIKDLRRSFRNTRLLFFFLAYCFHSNLSLDGQTIEKNEVLNCLEELPAGSKMRHALGCWFEEFAARSETNVVNQLLFFKREQPMVIRRDDHCSEKYTPLTRQPVRGDPSTDPVPAVSHSMNPPVKRVEVYVTRDHHGHYFPWRIVEQRSDETQRPESTPNDATRSKADATRTLKQLLNINAPTPPDKQSAPLSPLMLQTLEMIQGINITYGKPTILITGSFSRYLQGLCPSFNDIDLICTSEEAAEILMARLQAQNTVIDTEILQKVFIKAIPGCPPIRLPKMYNINLTEGDPGIKTVGLQATIDAGVSPKSGGVAPIHLPGVERPVICLPFHAETQLIIEALCFLTDHLDPLTERLQKDRNFCIPRTILFNSPLRSEERIYGLLMRCLLTLHKARQFQTLLTEGKTGYQAEPISAALYYTTKLKLQDITEKLQVKLQSHAYRNHFVRRLDDFITCPKTNNDCQKKKRQLIKGLMEILTVT